MLTCQHHISWVRPVDGGLHQCILCTQVVTKKDVHPKLEDLPEDFGRRWDAHEATRERAATPSPSPTPTPSPSPTPTPTEAAPPIARAPPAPRISAPPVPAFDPHPER